MRLIKGFLIDLMLRCLCWSEVVMEDFKQRLWNVPSVKGGILSVQQTLNMEMVNALGEK